MHPRETGNEKLSWTALEYEEKDRTPDWFWALGIIVVASSLASIIFGNYFFAVLLILSGLLLGIFAQKKPNTIAYELNPKGLKIGSRLYPYENIKSFWVQTSYTKRTPEGEISKPILFIKTERIFMPIISIPIKDEWAEEIHAYISARDIEEEEMLEHPSEKIMEFLGF